MRFSASLDTVLRLPRHPDWKYELIDGEAWLTPRPRPLTFVRPTDRPVPAVRPPRIQVAPFAPGDEAAVTALLGACWIEEDPYRSLVPDQGREHLRDQIQRTITQPTLRGATARDGGELCGCVLVLASSTMPTLSWLTVRSQVRDRGIASALLAVVVQDLAERGESHLASAASASNRPSLRWHLRNGFELTADPLESIMREQARRSHQPGRA